jgi:chromosome segregation protein
MNLSKISLFGFKSFADKVDLEFRPGITAIVGPNGCGKSNVSDGIRWALGEQSARLLRGDRMDDFIFAGNSRRKPLGLSEVSLTFTRNRGTLPTDYEDVNVVRRLYRSGESEYLLNKVPCRLRDITDMFIDTGLAGEPYALIEQGSIGSVVNARPADRRVLIEEAAGIMKYKTKKRAAVNKLEATEQNLLRIRDVIAEVERQRNSLKRQANKAERYKLLDQRATELKLFLRLREHEALWQGLQAVLATLGPLQEGLIHLRADRSGAEAALETARLAALSDEQALGAAQEALFLLRSHIDRDEAELRNLDQQTEDTERRRAEFAAALAALGETTTRLVAELEVAGGRIVTQEEEVARLELLVETKGKGLREVEAALAGAGAEHDRLRHQATHRGGQLALRRNELATFLERSRQMTAQAERLRQQHAEATSQRAGAEASSSADEARRAEASARLTTSRSTREAAQMDAARAREARRHLEAEIAGLAADVERQRGRLGSLRELKLQFADFSEGNKLLLQAGRDRRLGGVVGPLAEALETSPRHEKALEALLGMHLQGVRMETWAEAQEALAHLFRTGQGRATLLGPVPLGQGSWPAAARTALADRVAELPKELQAAVEGLALDLVRSPEGTAPWVMPFLADALIVSDLDTAVAVARELAGPFTLATLAGEVLTHRGALTGGTPAPQGLLGQRRELKELEEALAISETGLSGLREALRVVTEELATAERTAETSAGAERQAELDLLAIEKDLAARRAEELRLSQQLELFGIELQTVEEDLGGLHQEVDGLRARIVEEEEAVAALGHQLGLHDSALAGMREERDRVADGQSEARVALASAIAHRDETRRNLERMRQELAATDEQIERVRRESAEAALRLESLAAAQAVLRQGLGGLHEEEAGRQAALVAAQEARAATQGAIQAHEEGLRAKHHEEARTLEEIAALDTQRAELKSGLTHLEQDLLQSHAVGLSELRERFTDTALEVEAATGELEELKQKLVELGPANLGALEEYEALVQRHEFLTTQAEDLTKSVAALRQAIVEVNRTIQTLFASTLESVNTQFDRLWKRLIGGGSAELRLVEPDEGEPDAEAGVEMMIRIPGKRSTVLSLLSGGERALAALALLLALFAVRPSPFCVLDEVDAPLDDANVERLVALLREMSAQSQFIVITHNKRTMQAADTLYGVTMEEEGVSRVISVHMHEDLAA